jgi:hypothetical protein
MVKTSMQELIDWLDPSFSSVIDKAKELFEKEKQQIIDAFDKGNAAGYSQGSSNRTEDDYGEDYFNQTYNQ